MKEKAIKILTQLQKDNHYIQSIYLWGSIVTGEFVEGKSDIDAIAIVDESADISNKEILNTTLHKSLPCLKINFLYPSELNGGPIRETLARFVPVECILYDMPFWIDVAGRKFRKEDFVLGRKSTEEVIVSSLTNIKSRFLPEPSKDDRVYFVKALARLCYYVHQKGELPKPFRYHDLIKDSSDQMRAICEVIVRIKDSEWDLILIDTNIPVFKNFLNMFDL